MASQEHYSLRWNNHQNHILRAFDALLQTKTLVDVTLVCAETSIRAHKVVLSACSPFFQRVFAETPCKHPVIVLKDFNGWVVQAIVDFMYRGEISVPQERLQTLIQAGESLQVRGLIDHPVTGNTPTPAASPDDFNNILSSGHHVSRGETFLGQSQRQKLLFSPQIFMDGSFNTNSLMDSYNSSAMPRRKQARPRRRSGDFNPQDLTGDDQDRNDFDSENNKNFKNIRNSSLDRESGENKRSLSKSSSVLSLDGGDEPEDLCTKTIDSEYCDDLNLSGNKSAKNNSDPNSDLVVKKCNKRNSGNIKDKSYSDKNSAPGGNNNRIVLSLKDIRHLNNNSNSNNQMSESNLVNNHRIPNRFLAQSPNSILKSMSNHLGLSRSNLSPKDLNDAKYGLHRPGIDLASSKYYSHNEEEMDDEGNNEEDDQKMANNGDIDGEVESCDDTNNKTGPNDDRKSEDSLKHEHHENEVNNNNSRLNMLMMDSRNALLMDQMDFKQRQLMLHGGLDPKHRHHGQGMDLDRKGMNESLLGPRSNHKDYSSTSPISLPPHFNMPPADGGPPSSPLPFPPMPSVSALALTPPHIFGLDTNPLGLFPPGMDPSKLYTPLMEMSDPRGMHPEPPPFLKKKGKFLSRPKGQHSAPRGGPPRSWTNAELTEALQHVWNKKMTTSQASRIFGIPYNSLLMYVRGKYGKSLKLEQLRKDCISGPPIELLQMGINKNSSSNNNNNSSSSNNNNSGSNQHHGKDSLKDFDLLTGSGAPLRSSSSEPSSEMLSSPNPMFNPFPPSFYPDFASGFGGLPLSMLNLLPPDRQPMNASNLPSSFLMDEDCKSDRSKQSIDDDFNSQPLALSSREDNRHEILHQE